MSQQPYFLLSKADHSLFITKSLLNQRPMSIHSHGLKEVQLNIFLLKDDVKATVGSIILQALKQFFYALVIAL